MPHAILSPDALDRALALRDLTDPAQGPHAMQLLVDAAVNALAGAWGCPVTLERAQPIVRVADNYDRLLYPPGGAARDARYTRYVGHDTLLRTQTSAMIPPLLDRLAAAPPDDVLLACPGLVWRRDRIDRLHVGEPHQLESLAPPARRAARERRARGDDPARRRRGRAGAGGPARADRPSVHRGWPRGARAGRRRVGRDRRVRRRPPAAPARLRAAGRRLRPRDGARARPAPHAREGDRRHPAHPLRGPAGRVAAAGPRAVPPGVEPPAGAPRSRPSPSASGASRRSSATGSARRSARGRTTSSRSRCSRRRGPPRSRARRASGSGCGPTRRTWWCGSPCARWAGP